MNKFLQLFRPKTTQLSIPEVNYGLGNKPLFLDLNINRHAKLKAYAALLNKSMIDTVNEWIDSLRFEDIKHEA